MIDRRLLETDFYLTIQDITFASDAIGDANNGRSAASASWAQDATVVFKGKLKHILIFALMAFDVASVAINEKFDLAPARKFKNLQNLTPDDVVEVVSLDPADGEEIVLDDDLAFLVAITNNYRCAWTDRKNIVLELKADPTDVTLYRGTVLEALAYALQVHADQGAVVYTLFDFALSDVGGGVSKGMSYIELSGTSGPVEYEKGHVTLANLLLSVAQC